MAKRLTLISFRFWEVWEFAGNRGHYVVGRAMGQPAQLKAGDLSLILGACVHWVWAPGSGLRAPGFGLQLRSQPRSLTSGHWL